MKTLLRKTLAILITAGLLLSQALPVIALDTVIGSEFEPAQSDLGEEDVQGDTADDSQQVTGDDAETQNDIVFDEAALAEWLDEHRYMGGTVSLGDTVVLTSPIQVYAGAASSITIDTGAFGLIFDGGYFYSGYEYFHVSGEGVDVPVIDVLSMNSVWESWNSILMKMNIRSTGRDGIGGTALRIRAAGDQDFDLTNIRFQGMIESHGANAVGLWLDPPMDAYCYRVEVSGEGSAAVYAPNGASLYYCKLNAYGVFV